MIIHNTSSNVRVFSAKAGKLGSVSIFVLPGINGEYPEDLLSSEAFVEQKEAGVMVIIATPKDYKADVTRIGMKPDAAVKAPDNDVVEAFLAMPEAKAVRSINDLVKEATLKALAEMKKTGQVRLVGRGRGK